jgi:hypothetical protein
LEWRDGIGWSGDELMARYGSWWCLYMLARRVAVGKNGGVPSQHEDSIVVAWFHTLATSINQFTNTN